MINKVALLLLASISIGHGQIISLGSCPDYTAQADFDVDSYTGLWYEIEKYPFIFSLGDCITAQYTLSDDETYVTVNNTQIILGVSNSIYGSAVVSSDDGSGELSVTLEILGLFNETAPLIVLDTDYTSYSIVYSCSDLADLIKGEQAWILSRTPVISTDAETYVSNYIAESSFLNAKYYVTTDQSNDTCGYA